jgi:hypothetical protein
VSIDFGTVHQPTGLVVMERHLEGTGEKFMGNPNLGEKLGPRERLKRVYQVRHAKRFIGERYTRIIKDLAKVVSDITRPMGRDEILLTADLTAVGSSFWKPVGTALDEALRGKPGLVADPHVKVVGFKITNAQGDFTRMSDGAYAVPRQDLMSLARVLLEEGRLRIAKDLDLADVLRKELLEMRMKVKENRLMEDVWREGQFDDLSLAVLLGAWSAEKYWTPESRPTDGLA